MKANNGVISMKIQLQNLLFYPATGGIENYLYYTSKELINLGHEPTIFCSQHQNNLKKVDIFSGIKIRRHNNYELPNLPWGLYNPFYYTHNVYEDLKSEIPEYDVIWSRFFYDAYVSCKIPERKCPVIFIQAAIASSLNKISVANKSLIDKIFIYTKGIEENYFERKAIELSDKVIVLSEIRKREICDFYNMDEKKFEVVPPGIDLNFFKPSLRDESLLKELNIPIMGKIILTVCRLSREKNLEFLIRAFQKIKDNEIFLVIVGDGNEKERLIDLSRRLTISDNIRFAGERHDVNRFYSIADVFVLPSLYEGFGQVYIEAMASGVPCIGLKPDYPKVIVACGEIIDDGETGYIVDHRSIDIFSEKIKKLIDDDELKIKFGNNARKRCEERFSWQQSTKSLLEISEKLL